MNPKNEYNRTQRSSPLRTVTELKSLKSRRISNISSLVNKLQEKNQKITRMNEGAQSFSRNVKPTSLRYIGSVDVSGQVN